MADIYCDADSGDDGTGDGSSGNPYETLNKGITEASADDTVKLVPATADYTWVSDSIPAGLTIESSTGVPPDIVKGEYARVNGGGAVIQWTLGGNITCNNIAFYNVRSSDAGSPFKWGSLSGIDQVITMNDCVFEDTENALSTGGRGGIFGNGNSVSVPPQNSITVRMNRCLLYNNKGDATNYSGFIHTTSTGLFTVEIYECTIYNDSTGNGLEKIVANYSTNGCVPTYRNCLFVNDHADDLSPCQRYSGGSESSNVNYTDYNGNVDTTGVTFSNSNDQDPEFLDKAGGDFRLKASSPSIGTGQLV